MTGVLYLCATPIGNLEDITLRVLRTLKEVDLIAAEDTRHSIKLLNHYQIKTPMTSYHEFNKKSKGIQLIEKLKKGQNIALITDAGTPAVSDPGEDIVRLAYKEGITVYSLPGPSACITGLTLSGMDTKRFAFEAFLPTNKNHRRRILAELKNETRTIILYEAPHRLLKTLKSLYEYLGDRNITIERELTTKNASIDTTTIHQAIEKYTKEDPKGEIVLIIEGRKWEEIDQEEQKSWLSLSLEDHMDYYLTKGIDKKEAMKIVAKDRGLSKREVYNKLIELDS